MHGAGSVLRFAIAGLGNAARTIHLPALRKLPGAQCVGVYDERAAGAPEGVTQFLSLDQMLSEARPDVLVVATPPDSHFGIAQRGLDAGCHVFCEKPLTETLAEADELMALAASAGRHVIVNSEFPWMPMHAAAKQRMKQPGFGRLHFVSMHQTFLVTEAAERGWRGAGQNRTFKEFGTHVLDLASFFFDANPISVRARMPRPKGPDQPDHLALVELEFPGERCALIVLDRLSKGRHRYLDIRLDGDEATIETSVGGRLQATFGVNAKSRAPFLDVELALGGQARLYRGEHFEHLAAAPIDLFADATARLLMDVIAAISRGEEPPCSLRQARNTLRLLHLCYESAADGGLSRRVA
jgi:predicted dehydrogenase